MKKILAIFLLSIMLSSCGTIFKSERNFKKTSSQIDYDILALDLLGLSLLIVPGIVMITIDNITGALYLSPTEAANFKSTSIQQQAEDLIIQ